MVEDTKSPVSKKKHINKKLILLILFIITLISLAFLFYYFILSKPNNNYSESPEVTAIKEKVDIAINLGKYEESIGMLDKAIDAAKTDEGKNILKTKKIVLMIKLQEYNSALELAIDVEKEIQSENIYSLLGDIYKELGQPSKAVENYKKAKSYVGANSPMAKGTLEYYNSLINGLSES